MENFEKKTLIVNRETDAKRYAKQTQKFRVGLALLFGVSLALLPFVAAAATLYFTPSSGTVGQTFSIAVYVSSAEQAMNAASGIISFPPEKLEVTSLSKSGSIFNLWVQEPLFSNAAGTINFEGIVLNPGFIGSVGKIITVNFRVKSTGSAYLSFSSASVLANDGRGTNILTGIGSGNYFFQTTAIIAPAEEIEETAPPVALGIPLAPKVSSPTHPDPEKWYSNNDPEFSWKLPSDVTGVSLLLHESPTGNPGSVSDGKIESKKYEDIEDGEWYFHINFRNQYGWGKITHRKVLIDTVPPEQFNIIVDKKGELTSPDPVLYFETKDELSGLEYYEVIIDGGEGKNVALADITRNPFQMPAQTPGGYAVEVKAFDKAGNYTSATAQVEILPIQAPVITKYPKRLDIGQALALEGESLPDVANIIFVQEKNQRTATSVGETIANESGKWIFSSAKTLEKGEYIIWAVSQDERGAQSLPSSKVQISVSLPPFLQFGKIVIDYLTIMITFIVLIAAAVVVIFYGWYRITIWRKRVRLETKELSQAILAAFKALREEVQEQIEYLDGKPGLTNGEEKVRNKLKEALDVSEEFVSKELKDVERELE